MSLLNAPRWLLITEAVLLVGALLVVAYKAATWVRPLGRVEQSQFLKKVDPAVRVREYYEQYPERYIRIGQESWRYAGGTAYHSFTLTNQATVGYEEIGIELNYQGRGGKTLLSRTVTLKNTLAPLGTLQIAGLEVKNVPPGSESVLLRITGAKVATHRSR